MSKLDPKSLAVQAASLHFSSCGTPVSNQFEDFYFSTDNGLQETEYVFLQANALPQRWFNHPQDHFVIGETGFGTGLNFLASWACFEQSHNINKSNSNSNSNSKNSNSNDDNNTVKRLHFISFEKYPLQQADLANALAQWPQLSKYADALLEQYPRLLPGCHRLVFNQGFVTLDLWFGDIKDTLPQLFHGKAGYIDAWYLDGFAPSKNADMWCDEVYQGMKKLSKSGTTLSTFTAAAVVRKGLQAAGFEITKITGFGKKRQMITGKVNDQSPSASASASRIAISSPISSFIVPPFYYRHSNHQPDNKTIAIIGGGIASATLCYALAKRGFEITLYCKDAGLAQGASQNKQGALYPLLHADYDSLSEFYSLAFGYALRLYRDLLRQKFDFSHSFCGVLIAAYDDKVKRRQQSLIDNNLWPQSLLRPVTSAQASDIAGLNLLHSGLYFADGGWINPASLIDALLQASRQLTKVNIKLDNEVTALNQTDDNRWQLSTTQGSIQGSIQGTAQTTQATATFDNAVICSGHLASRFAQTQALSLAPIRGQVSHLPVTEDTAKLKTVLCSSGYFTPAFEQSHCIGSSFIKGDESTEIRTREHEKNIDRLKQCLGHHDWVDNLPMPTQGRASTRCASIDHLPLVGAVPDHPQYLEVYRDLWKGLRLHHYKLPPDYRHLYILTALGARGLCSAPLCSEILAAQINNEPYPVSTRVLNALNPGRGYVKGLKTRG